MSKTDPTNQAKTRKKATTDISGRINNVARFVLSLWRDIEPKRTSRKKIVNNEDLVFWQYDMTPEEMNAMYHLILDEFNVQLETGQESAPQDWFYSQYTGQSYTSGVNEDNTVLENLFPDNLMASAIGGAIAGGFIPLTLSQKVSLLIEDQYRTFSGLSERSSQQVYKTIFDGMSAGLSKTSIRKEIIRRFEVSKSNAKRIVDTEVNKANNNGKIDTTIAYRENGANTAVMHVSALIPTTRHNHAARHGNVYTPEQQRQWWDEGTNRINCHCSVKPVRVNRDGTVQNVRQQKRMKKEKKEFFGLN